MSQIFWKTLPQEMLSTQPCGHSLVRRRWTLSPGCTTWPPRAARPNVCGTSLSSCQSKNGWLGGESPTLDGTVSILYTIHLYLHIIVMYIIDTRTSTRTCTQSIKSFIVCVSFTVNDFVFGNEVKINQSFPPSWARAWAGNCDHSSFQVDAFPISRTTCPGVSHLMKVKTFSARYSKVFWYILFW